MVLRQKAQLSGNVVKVYQKDVVDERVKIRCHYFLHPEERLTPEEIDKQITEKALEEGAGSALQDIIGKMVKEFAFNVAKMDLEEFIVAFRRNNLSMVIAEKFANSLQFLDAKFSQNDVMSDEVRAKVENALVLEIRQFLAHGGLLSSELLHDLLKQKKSEYPDVSIQALFREDLELEKEGGDVCSTNLVEILANEIDRCLQIIAEVAYKEKFEADKRGFVMGYMMGKVVKYDQDKGLVEFSSVDFYRLMKYLDSLGYNIARIDGEGLYDWLFEESRSMATYLDQKRVESEQLGIRNSLANVLRLQDHKSDAAPGFLNGDFDVQKFYQSNILPKLFYFYSKKINKLNKVREPDFLNKMNDPSNDISANYTTHLVRYLQVLHNTYRHNSADFIAKIRELFGLNDSPLLKSLSHKEVLEYIEQYMELAKEKMETVRKEALLFRMKDADILAACDYPNEIKGCKNLGTLIGWILDPKDFLRTHPQYTDWTEMMVRAACGSMIRDFLIVTKELSSERFTEIEQKREWSEKRMRKSLGIKILDAALPVDFRMMKGVKEMPNGKSKKVSKVIFGQKKVDKFIGTMDRDFSAKLMEDPSITEVEYEGQEYVVSGIERKMFVRAQMTIPVMEYDAVKKIFRRSKKPRVIEVLIYIGGDNSALNEDLIHAKGAISMVMSQDRGKEVSDKIRCMMCFANSDDEDAYRDYLYSDNARSIVKADDPKEGRRMNTKNGKGARTQSSQSFKENQSFSIAKVLSFPRKNSKGELEMVEATIETQCQDLEKLISTNLSHYSDTSHDIYKAQRSWPRLFSYFPPEIFGDKYKEFKSRGYRQEV